MFVRVLLVFILLVVMPQIPMLEPWLWRVESVYNQNHNLFKSIKKWPGIALVLVTLSKSNPEVVTERNTCC